MINSMFIRWSLEVINQEYGGDIKLFNANMKQNSKLEVRS